jgi:DNA polymerase
LPRLEPEISNLLRLHIESGADESYEAEPRDYLSMARPTTRTFPSGLEAEETVSIGEATEKAREAALAANNIEELGAAAARFDLCQLKKFSTSSATGRGAQKPALLCISEIPNAIEDRTGEFPSGDTGELLLKILAAIGRSLETDAFAMPLVPWRPAGGRAPTGEEISVCAPFAERAIEILKPRAILAFGSAPAAFLLGSDEPLTQLRGNWGEYKGIPIMPTFPLSMLLSNREAKKKTWDDVQAVEGKLKEL